MIRLRANATTKDLLTRLPVTGALSDFAGAEKIVRLSGRLSTADAPAGMDPSVGDLAYYAPWGNLAIFYKDQPYAAGLVPLGTIESGLSDLAALDSDTAVTINVVETK